MSNFCGKIPLWDCPHWGVVPFLDLRLLGKQARQTVFILLCSFPLPRKWFNPRLWLTANTFLLFYHIISSCYNILLTAFFAMGTWPRSQWKGTSLCTSWLEVSSSQISPNSPTPKLLGHNAAGSSLAQKVQKGPPRLQRRFCLYLNTTSRHYASCKIGFEFHYVVLHLGRYKSFAM